jgi:hypothetical protein
LSVQERSISLKKKKRDVEAGPQDGETWSGSHFVGVTDDSNLKILVLALLTRKNLSRMCGCSKKKTEFYYRKSEERSTVVALPGRMEMQHAGRKGEDFYF